MKSEQCLYSDLVSQLKEIYLPELCVMFLSWRKGKNRGKILVLPTMEGFGGTRVHQAPNQGFFFFWLHPVLVVTWEIF